MAFFRPLFTAGIILTSMAVAASARADTVSGKVVGPDGKPVAGAKVVVRAFGPTPPFDLTTAKTLTSDGSGEFRIDAVPPVRPKEGNPTVARAFVSMPGFGLAQAFLTLHPSENNTIRLEKSTTLSGKLVDTAGKPVAGAGVQLVHFSLRSPQPDDGANSFWLENDDIPKSLLTAKTDADGIWTLSGLPGKAAEAGVRLTDGKFLQSVVMFPVPASGLTKTLVAHPAATLTGRVIGRDGKPRPGIHLYTRSEDFRGGSTTATTDANGVYQLAGLPTGSFVVLVTDDATSYLTGAPPEEIALPLRGLLLTEGKETTAPDLVMMPGGLVEGAVLDAVDNRPVTEAVIMVLDTIGIRVAYSGSVAGAEGRFKLRLPPGRFRLAIPSRPEGYLNELESGEAAMVDVVVTEGGTVPAVFRLPRSKTVSGLAQDVNGSPVPNVVLAGIQNSVGTGKTITDANGRWILKGIKPGSLRIIAINDFEVVAGDEVTVGAKEEMPPDVVTVAPFKRTPITGRVRTVGREPIAGVRVDGHAYQLGNTDPQGRFTLPPIRSEDRDTALKFTKPGYRTVSGGILSRVGGRFVVSDAVMDALDTGRTIKGRVTDGKGKPVSGAIVAAIGVAVGPGETRTDGLGRFSLPGVPEESRLLAAQGAMFGSVTVSRKTGVVTVPLAATRKVIGSAAEDYARAVVLVREIKKQYLDAKRRNEKVDDFAVRELPLAVAPLDFPLALELAKPAGTNTIDDQTLAQMIREIAQHNPARLNDWAIPALENIGITAVRASAAYAVVIGLPDGPAKKALAQQVYGEMKLLTLTGNDHWVVRRVTQMAVLAAMLGLPEESQSWADKAILGATEDKTRQYLSVVAFESVNGGLPLVRYVLQTADSKQRADLYWQVLPRLARINPRAAQKLLADREADPELSTVSAGNEYSRNRSLLELVRALAPQDPAAALLIAEKPKAYNYAFLAAAVTLCAQAQPNTAKAALLYRRAASFTEAYESPIVLAKIAAIAWKSDPEIGKDLFDRANQAIRDRNSGQGAASFNNKTALARELTDFQPGESRLLLTIAKGYLLTPEGQKEDTTGTYRKNLALAWLPFSVDQALAIAQRLPEKQENSGYSIRNQALKTIVAWLLTDPAKRSKLLLSDYDQFGFDPQNY